MRVLHILLLSAAILSSTANARDPVGFKSGSIVLYQPDARLNERLGSDADFAAYIKRIDAACTTFFASEKTPEQLDIVVGVKPQKKVRVWFTSSRRPSSDKTLIALRKKLGAIPPCEVHTGPLAFAMRCTIAGAAESTEIPMPKEWRDAGRSLLVPDGIFEKIWRG